MKDDKKLEAPSKKRVPIKFRKGEDDGTGRLAMEDVYASGYKVKSYVDPETGETKTRKVRAHRIEFKNSGMGAKPEITKEEKMKKTFSQFKEEYGLDEAKFAKGGIPSAPNTGNRDDGYTKRQRQRAAKKRAEEITKQRRQRAMGEELNLEDFSLEEIEEFMMSEEYGLDEAKFAKGGIPSAPNTGNKDDGYTKRQRQRAAKKRAEELTKQRREREMKEELNLEDFSLEEIEDFMMSEDFEQLDELSKSTLTSYRDKSNAQIDRGLMRSRDIRGDKTAMKRLKNIGKAKQRLAKEDYEAQDALEYLFSLDEDTFNHMMEEYGLDASVEIILTRMNEGLQDDILAVAKTISPNARVRPSVADQIKKRDEMIKKREEAMKSKPQPKGGSEKPYEKYPLGGYDPVSRRSYSD